MSGNIHDTNVSNIRCEVSKLIADLSSIVQCGESPADHADELERKYKAISKTSKTLFQFIVTQYGTERFDERFFKQTLNSMLTQVEKIQSSELSQHDASSNIGALLAKNFIPQLQ
jgi:predicted RNA-binding protein with PIN domain